MAKKEIVLKYAPGVTPAPEGEMSPDVAESLKGPRKIRITTMVDLAVYDELKRQAAESGQKYQTYLNDILSHFLLGSAGKVSYAAIEARLIADEKAAKAMERRMARIEKEIEMLRKSHRKRA